MPKDHTPEAPDGGRASPEGRRPPSGGLDLSLGHIGTPGPNRLGIDARQASEVDQPAWSPVQSRLRLALKSETPTRLEPVGVSRASGGASPASPCGRF